MINLEDVGRLYIWGPYPEQGKTHLYYIRPPFSAVEQLCLPNIPVQATWSCREKGDDGDSFTAGLREAEWWDKYYGELTCLTCLKRARGEI
ncbi:hypothetical protein LCGC14_0637540 [marine sediment metagenome]|uniref:Uncharacterized protein n=1 Tax=marine sediment metagenome TaxID=412755 RepID=A0A0F9U8I8_9ZZZZ